MDQTALKRLAAEAALQYLPERGVVGLGSGSTVRFFIEGVGALVRAGRYQLQGVPTSEESRQVALREGISLLADEGPWDGSDEIAVRSRDLRGRRRSGHPAPEPDQRRRGLSHQGEDRQSLGPTEHHHR